VQAAVESGGVPPGAETVKGGSTRTVGSRSTSGPSPLIFVCCGGGGGTLWDAHAFASFKDARGSNVTSVKSYITWQKGASNCVYPYTEETGTFYWLSNTGWQKNWADSTSWLDCMAHGAAWAEYENPIICPGSPTFNDYDNVEIDGDNNGYILGKFTFSKSGDCSNALYPFSIYQRGP